MNTVFTGSCVALITPFKDGKVNYAALKNLLEFQIRSHTDAILVCGTTGEPSTMTAEEKREVIRFTVETVDRRVPVLAGTGGNNTEKVIEDSRIAEGLGVDALLLVTPYYNKCTQKGLIAHYHAVADRVNIPIIVYNVPGRTGVNILPATMAAIVEHRNIVGVKEACGNMDQICETAIRIGKNAALYSGDDGLTLPILSVGGKGVISVTANIIPEFMHNLTAAVENGDYAGAQKMHAKLFPLAKAMFLEVNPIPVKSAANLLGLQAGELRMPLTPMEEANLEKLKAAMSEFGLVF